MTLGVGVHDITGELYHADPCEQPSLSASLARVLCSRSPLHAWTAHPRLNPDFEKTEDEKFDIGTAAHALLLQGEDIVRVVDAADWRTAAAKEARAEAREAGLTALLTDQYEAVQKMVAAARAQYGGLAIQPALFQDGDPEQTLIWRESSSVWCRARLDWLRDDGSAIDDYKTTSRPANPEQWSRTLFSMGYDVQAAFYTRAVEAVLGTSPIFRLVVQETSPPYALSVLALSPDALALAREKMDYAVRRFGECLATGNWPGYPREVCFAQVPGWEMSSWLEKEAREEVAA